MAQFGLIFLVIALAIPLWALLRRDFVAGMSYALFLWVSMTTFLRISLPGILPELTLHRLLLIIVVLAWLHRHSLSEIRSVPLIGCFGFWIAANLLSLSGTQIDFVSSLKRFLDFVLEVFAFYVVASTSLRTEEDVRRVLRGAWLGLLLVACLGIVERYTGFNPVDRFIPGYERDDVARHDVLSTYQHRILLGTAMAMGLPVSFLLLQARLSAGQRPRFIWGAIALLAAACYFSFSRGPWMALLLACGIMMVMASGKIRKSLLIIGGVAGLVLIARPGVLETFTGFAKDTADSDSFKGGTFHYRLELWKVAYNEVSKSPWSFLFGYGPGAGAVMDVQRELSYRGKTQKIESWDNHFAYSLFQSGVVGLMATLLLYFKALGPIFQAWRWSLPPTRDLLACLLAAAAIIIWMMTNVLIFAKQLDYLFWTVIAAGWTVAQRSEWVEPLAQSANHEALPIATAWAEKGGFNKA